MISGTGTLTKTGAGTLTLTGTNTYTGTTTIDAGTLQGDTASLQGNITNDANVTFDQAGDGTFADTISGTGTLTKTGTGTLTLTGTHTYSGATLINNGTLSVNGSMASSTTTVNAGGTLGGTGTAGTVILNGGTVAPGNSIGTMNVAGDVDFSGGGVYEVEVDAAGNSDLITATGTATLGGGRVQVLPAAGSYGFTTDYTILTAAGGLNGEFDSVDIESTFAFLAPTLSYDTNNVFLNLTRNSVGFDTIAATPNQTAVAGVLTALSLSNPQAVAELTDQLLFLTPASARQAFDSLSGVQQTHAQRLLLGLNNRFGHLLFNRVAFNPGAATAFDPFDAPLLAYNGHNPALLAAAAAGTAQADRRTTERGLWLQGFGEVSDIEDTANAGGADYESYGLAFGIDTDWRDIIIGLAGSYANSDVDAFNANTGIDSFQAALYGGWQRNDYRVMAQIGAGYHDADASRSVIIGTAGSVASADYGTLSLSAGVEASKAITLQSGTTLSPYLGLDARHIDRGGFTETGAGAANLAVRDTTEDSLQSRIGLRLSHAFTRADGSQLTPYAYAGYVREYLDDVSALEAGFSAVPAATFRIDGAKLDRNRAEVGAGLTGGLNEKLSVKIGYDGRFAGSDNHHSVSATLRMRW